MASVLERKKIEESAEENKHVNQWAISLSLLFASEGWSEETRRLIEIRPMCGAEV